MECLADAYAQWFVDRLNNESEQFRQMNFDTVLEHLKAGSLLTNNTTSNDTSVSAILSLLHHERPFKQFSFFLSTKQVLHT